MTRAEIAAVIGKIEGLNSFGVGLYDRGQGLTTEEHGRQLRDDEERLLASGEVCAKVCGWLAGKVAIKTMNDRHSSYGLKHMAEAAVGVYVPNGAFIAAAVHCGFPFRVVKDSPNVLFGISEKSLKR